MARRRMLIVSKLAHGAQRALVDAGAEADLDLEVVSSEPDALQRLSEAVRFEALVVDMHADGAQRLLSRCRKRRDLSNVPIIMLTRQISDLTFARAYRWGADDIVLRRGAPELIARLATVPSPAPLSKKHPRGEALVADPDGARADIVGRVLATAGYEVRYGVDERSLDYYLGQRSIRLVVLSTEFGDFQARYEAARQSGNDATWIISAKRDLRRITGICGQYSRMAVVGHASPPDNVLFLANDLSGDSGKKRQRESVRHLFGTSVTFRAVGTAQDEYGFSYNVSGSGLFIRTLSPPKAKQLWIDVRPPHDEQMVRLLGEVRWTRPFGQLEFATAPPGFGVSLVEGLGDSVERWRAALERLGAAVAAGEPSYSDPPPSSELDGVTRIASLIEEQVASVRGTLTSLSDEFGPQSEAGGDARGSLASLSMEDDAAPPIEATRDSASGPRTSAGGATESRSSASSPSITVEEPSGDADGQSMEDPGVARRSPMPSGDITEDSVSGAVRTLDETRGSQRPRGRQRLALFAAAVLLMVGAGVAGLSAIDKEGAESPAPHAVTSPEPTPAVVDPEGRPEPSGAALQEPAGSARPVAPAAEGMDPGDKRGPGSDSDPGPSKEALSALPPTQGFLFVLSPIDADVSVHGVSAGRTNRWIQVRCGARFIRLGNPGDWLTRGESAMVACQGATEVSVEPDKH